MDHQGIAGSGGRVHAHDCQGLLGNQFEGADSTNGDREGGGQVRGSRYQDNGQEKGERITEVLVQAKRIGDGKVNGYFAEPNRQREQENQAVLPGRAKDTEAPDKVRSQVPQSRPEPAG